MEADLTAYMPGAANQTSFNLLLASIGANGIGVAIGAGVPPGVMAKVGLPLSVGYGVLDRATGKLRYFADGLDESVAEMNVGPDGAYYSPSSPILRAFARVLFPARRRRSRAASASSPPGSRGSSCATRSAPAPMSRERARPGVLVR